MPQMRQQIVGWACEEDCFLDFGIQSRFERLATSIRREATRQVGTNGGGGSEEFCAELQKLAPHVARYVHVLVGNAARRRGKQSGQDGSFRIFSLSGIYFTAIPDTGHAYFLGDVFRLKIFRSGI